MNPMPAINVDLYPGEAKKPVVTMVAMDNYMWGKIPEDPVPVELPPPKKEDPIVITKVIEKPAPKPLIKTVV